MLESLSPNMEMQYRKLSPEEQSQRGILGRLVGVIADFKNPTRNGRLYTEELWDKTFENPIMKEKLANRCLFGELGHPTDRQEVDMEKIAICMAEEPKKGSDGKLHGVFDILATPNGKILKTLCDYGCAIGVSSRGSGDTYEDFDGQEKVDEDTFECECWDAVLLPAVKSARPKYVTESLSTKKSLKEALEDVVKSASEDDRKVMKETIDNLDIDKKDDEAENEAKSDVISEQEVAGDAGADLVTNLQEALQENSKLQRQVVTLNEKLSVSYTKEVKLTEDNQKLRDAMKQLTERLRRTGALASQVEPLKAQLSEQTELAQKRASIIEGYKEHLKDATRAKGTLKESISSRDVKINTLESRVKELSESLAATKRSSKNETDKLTEEISQLKTESAVKHSEYAKKLSRANQLVEKYRKESEAALTRYMESKARTLGVSVNEIRNRLNENYSFDDIDSVCDKVRSYKMNMHNLPFSLTENIQKVTAKENTSKRFTNPDDEIDESLLNMLQ